MSVSSDFSRAFSNVSRGEQGFEYFFNYIQNDFYLVTNESGQKKTLQSAGKLEVTTGKVLLFTSGMLGLNYAAARGKNTTSDQRVEYLVCVDISPITGKFWDFMRTAISGTTREECAKKIRNYVKDNGKFLFQRYKESVKLAELFLEDFEKELTEGTSWLSTDSHFQTIQKIFDQGHFAFVHGNLFSITTTQGIVNTLQNLSLTLDSIYISNVREYAEMENCLDKFRVAFKVFKQISHPKTLLVDVRPRHGSQENHVPAMQRTRKNFIKAPMRDILEKSPDCDTSCKIANSLQSADLVKAIFAALGNDIKVFQRP